MANKIVEDATKVLTILFNHSESQPYIWLKGDELAQLTGGLKPSEINDAVENLDYRGLIKRRNYGGTVPYRFGQVMINSHGKSAYYEITASAPDPAHVKTQGSSDVATLNKPPLPIGSPYGFTEQDWEYVQKRKRQPTTLFVVMGFQFISTHYNTENLKRNILESFNSSVQKYNQRDGREDISIDFKPLAAGYGEHLFDQIARDIIGADIAVFETSDLNPNVMIEMGAALTWGSRVLPIKKVGREKPPSDISGQTWADYTDDARTFVNPNHEDDLLSMIERAIQKKAI